MKKLIPVLFVLMLIGSCKKEVCYTCITSTYQKGTDILLNTDTEILCNKTNTEILDYEISHFNFDDPQSYTSCECKRQ